MHPGTGDLYVTNTEARNLVRFEPNLRGHIIDNRVTRVGLADGLVAPADLNPTIDYSVLPNESAKASAIAQPTATSPTQRAVICSLPRLARIGWRA